MTGKKALERLKNDPDLVARSDGRQRSARRWANGREELCDGQSVAWWNLASTNARSMADGNAMWTLYRTKKLRDVFTEPKVGDVVQDTTSGHGDKACLWEIWNIDGSQIVLKYSECCLANGKFAGHTLTRAEFAVRAKAPFNWTVVSRAS